jgi:hypothetical protein
VVRKAEGLLFGKPLQRSLLSEERQMEVAAMAPMKVKGFEQQS